MNEESNRFITSLVDEAHVNFLNRNYDEVLRQLKSIKLRVKKKEHLDLIQEKEKFLDNEYNMRRKTINADDDVELLNKIMALKEWQSQEYISYYSRIIEDYDL